MKGLAIIFALLATVLLGGCGEGPGRNLVSIFPTTLPTTPPSAPSPPNIAGNWQFSATPSTSGARPFSIAGGISQADTTASGALHVDNSNCFDRLITRSLAGTVSADMTSLTATGSDGQVVTLTGNFTSPAFFYGTVVYANFTGTYKIDGGCAAGDHGTITGSYIDSIARESDPTQLSGTFTNSSAQTFHVTGNIVQSSSVSAAGSFEFTGNATFDTPCLGMATITAGTYPSGSFILGLSCPGRCQLSVSACR